MCFTHLPFGLKDACRVFTQVKQEIYRPLRGAGMLLNFLIDDVMGGTATLPAAVFQCWVVVRLLVLLGFYLGIDKSQFFPQQMVQHLGLILITKGAVRFEVPAKKLRAILHRVTE
jgi:hypothetical protein